MALRCLVDFADTDKGRAETVFFLFHRPNESKIYIRQMKAKSTSDEAKSLSVSMNAIQTLRQLLTVVAQLSTLRMTKADRKQLCDTVHDFCIEVNGIIQGAINMPLEYDEANDIVGSLEATERYIKSKYVKR